MNLAKHEFHKLMPIMVVYVSHSRTLPGKGYHYFLPQPFSIFTVHNCILLCGLRNWQNWINDKQDKERHRLAVSFVCYMGKVVRS